MRIGSAIGGVVTLALALGTAGVASATTTVSRSGNTITITGGDEVNFVEQPSSGDAGPLLYTDRSGINFGDGCADAGTGNTVQCGTLGPGLVAQISLGGGDDTLQPDATLATAPQVVVDLGAGNDTMWGSAHDDQVTAGPGNDVVNGRGGNDVIDGGDGADQLSGGAADDTITGGPGRDSLNGDGEFAVGYWGNDTLLARDGEMDALSCSLGADTAQVDAVDTFDARGDCEQVDVAAAGGDPASTPLRMSIIGTPAGRLSRLGAGRPFVFRASFSAACSGVATLQVAAREARRTHLGRTVVTLGRLTAGVPGGTFDVSMTIRSAYRAKLRRAKRVAATLRLACTDAGGRTVRASRSVTLR